MSDSESEPDQTELKTIINNNGNNFSSVSSKDEKSSSASTSSRNSRTDVPRITSIVNNNLHLDSPTMHSRSSINIAPVQLPRIPSGIMEADESDEEEYRCRNHEENPNDANSSTKGGVANLERTLREMNSTRKGLTSEEAQARLEKYGYNSLPEKKVNPLLLFFSFMWNPLAWAMEIAAVIAIILLDYADFALIVALLLLNCAIGYYEERSSSGAIAALRAQLSPTCKVFRNGELQKINAEELVPGDVCMLRLGDIVPADCVLFEGEGLKVDQSSLTGESLPVSKSVGSEVYSGSAIKMGEVEGVVYATGVNTFFGKAATLISETENNGSLQRVLRNIGWFCISLISLFVFLELILVFGVRHSSCPSLDKCDGLANILVLIVGGIPIAMPTVLSVTLAIGAQKLAEKQAIVSRLTAVEELAGMDILCSDKTGTLTKNKLTLARPKTYGGAPMSVVVFQAAIASKPEMEDAIDIAIVEYCTKKQQERRAEHEVLFFRPFDPIAKKAFAKVKNSKGQIFHTAKGAPQVILNSAVNKDEIAESVERDVDDFARRGYRSLGVAVSDEEGKKWIMTGVIPMFDPPRDDTAATIQRIQELGVKVKMITGDQLAIAKETARLLGMGQTMYLGSVLDKPESELGRTLDEIVLEADGFAQVFPENKFAIVQNLQLNKHIVGMTGDGVNDAPALKKANIGIAVAGATDAARAASDIVLTSPGLSVIADSIVGARKIFQRMKNYCTYSVMAVVRVVFTFGLLTLIFNFFFPTIAIVILAILNDISMITISKDRVKPNPMPDRWSLSEIFSIAITMGLYLSGTTIALYCVAVETNTFERSFGLHKLDQESVKGLIYLYVSITNLGAIFVTRSQRFSYKEMPGWYIISAFVIAQIIASFLGAYGLGGFDNFHGSGWGYVLVAWIWAIITFLFLDPLKLVVKAVLKNDIFPWARKSSLSNNLNPYNMKGRKRQQVKRDKLEQTISVEVRS